MILTFPKRTSITKQQKMHHQRLLLNHPRSAYHTFIPYSALLCNNNEPFPKPRLRLGLRLWAPGLGFVWPV